jgi:hypothetical protein
MSKISENLTGHKASGSPLPIITFFELYMMLHNMHFRSRTIVTRFEALHVTPATRKQQLVRFSPDNFFNS